MYIMGGNGNGNGAHAQADSLHFSQIAGISGALTVVQYPVLVLHSCAR